MMTSDEAFEAWLATVPDLYATSRSDYRRLKTAWEAATARAKLIADHEAASCRFLRIAQGDLERNFYGGGLASAELISDCIRSTPRAARPAPEDSHART